MKRRIEIIQSSIRFVKVSRKVFFSNPSLQPHPPGVAVEQGCELYAEIFRCQVQRKPDPSSGITQAAGSALPGFALLLEKARAGALLARFVEFEAAAVRENPPYRSGREFLMLSTSPGEGRKPRAERLFK